MNLDHYATKVQKKNIAAKSNRRKLVQVLQYVTARRADDIFLCRCICLFCVRV